MQNYNYYVHSYTMNVRYRASQNTSYVLYPNIFALLSFDIQVNLPYSQISNSAKIVIRNFAEMVGQCGDFEPMPKI